MSRKGSPNPPALQLYTLREMAGKDFTGMLRNVAAVGYGAVEFAGYGGLSAPELKKRLDDLGLVTAGSHIGFEAIAEDTDNVIDFNLAIGNKWIVCPSMPGGVRTKGGDGFRSFGEQLNRLGERYRAAGLRLAYHNHSFEFAVENGRPLIEYLFEATDPKLVAAEVDVYWVKHGGVDPAVFIAKYADRCKLIHMKDMTNTTPPTFAPVGTGILDMKAIVAAAKKAGAEWYIVEQDRTTGSAIEAVETSCRNLRALID